MHMTSLLLVKLFTSDFVIFSGITKHIITDVILYATIQNYFPSVGNIPLILRPRGIFPTEGK